MSLLVSNKCNQIERHDQENTNPPHALDKSIAMTIKKSLKASSDAVEPSSRAMAISASEVGQKKAVSVVNRPQSLELKFEHEIQEIEHIIKEKKRLTYSISVF